MRAPKLKFSFKYFAITLLLFATETLIALFVHDDFVRPYLGDVLVVILIYCFLKSFVAIRTSYAVIFVLLFSFLIEYLQSINFVSVIGLQDSKLANTILGNSFAYEDLLAYLSGALIIAVAEKFSIKFKLKINLLVSTFSTKSVFFILMLALLQFSCNSKEERPEPVKANPTTEQIFDRQKWQTKNGDDYPYRSRMLDDLVKHRKLHGLNKSQILKMLGKPDRIDNNYLFYEIEQQRITIMPLHTKTMVIKLDKNGITEWVKIHE
ncbi:MAG: DUF2809 domain-containing protein [Flavobacterium sp.]|nr:MAG: DUF2809 domain-containing protein [Flavobacterium sp.]